MNAISDRQQRIAWISTEILPHERDVRAWLRASFRTGDEDDIVQEAYYLIARVENVSHIQSGRAYFFTVVRNIVLEQIRRSRTVNISTLAEIESLNIVDDGPSPEQTAGARQELLRVQHLIDELPPKCRTIFRMRKVQELSQREVSHRLGIPESTVEKQVAKGLRLLLKALAEGAGHDRIPGQGRQFGPARKQRRN